MKTQRRGPITDYFGWMPDGSALCVCPHTAWPEGGYGCEACIREALADPEHPSNKYAA